MGRTTRPTVAEEGWDPLHPLVVLGPELLARLRALPPRTPFKLRAGDVVVQGHTDPPLDRDYGQIVGLNHDFGRRPVADHRGRYKHHAKGDVTATITVKLPNGRRVLVPIPPDCAEVIGYAAKPAPGEVKGTRHQTPRRAKRKASK